jgi:hypothetical protein
MLAYWFSHIPGAVKECKIEQMLDVVPMYGMYEMIPCQWNEGSKKQVTVKPIDGLRWDVWHLL